MFFLTLPIGGRDIVRRVKSSRRGKKRGKKGYDYSKNKYLGKKVKDINKPGLDSVKEFREIIREILRDYKSGRISEKTARGRFLLLLRLTYKKNNSKIRHLSNQTLLRLRYEIKRAMSKL